MGYYGNDMLEQFKYTSDQQAAKSLNASTGYITSVDPSTYKAKVMLEPIGIETEWLPIGTMYAGNGFGLLSLPDEGTEVLVVFEMGNISCGKIICCNFNNIEIPPALEVGEVMMLHQSGSFFKFHANGDVELNASGKISITDSSGVRL
jgi:phage gp45-like